VDNGAAIAAIKYTTANASGATVTNLPTGITAAWASNTVTISGSSTVTGTAAYTVTTTNANGCTNATATGTITVKPPCGASGQAAGAGGCCAGLANVGGTCTLPSAVSCDAGTFDLGAVNFRSASTWVVGAQTWSAPVVAANCNDNTFVTWDGSNYANDCRYSQNNSNYANSGNIFTWCLAAFYGAQLCPYPWRMPDSEDFCILARFVSNSASCSPPAGQTWYEQLESLWSPSYPGVVSSGSFVAVNDFTGYWCVNATATGVGYYTQLSKSNKGMYNERTVNTSTSGMQVRCVMD